MITTKERASLKSIAHPLKPLLQIGKGNVSEAVLKQAEEYLFNAELIKIKVLQNAEFKARDIANDLAKSLDAEIVSCLGNIITLYKFSKKKDIEHIKY